MRRAIPVIDIFAGPGGLGEGFASLTGENGRREFDVRLSIEKNPNAYQTLMLRAFYRQFQPGHAPPAYYKYLRKRVTRDELFRLHPKAAERACGEAWNIELCEQNHDAINRRIAGVLSKSRSWVLIGGPPCQAYSVIGRSRMKGADLEKYESDERHYLYREYLKIIADHRPPVFVMENVQGILSSTINGKKTFHQILEDLSRPHAALRAYHGTQGSDRGDRSYNIFSLSRGGNLFSDIDPGDFVIRAEDYGIPQTRHRVILLGIRSDLGVQPETLTPNAERVTVRDVISDLPKIRSVISRGEDSRENWVRAIRTLGEARWYGRNGLDPRVWSEMSKALKTIDEDLSCGDEFIASPGAPKAYRRWYADARIGGVCNHTARAHIVEDLHRYLFVGCFARIYGRSPVLQEFPKPLLPLHENVEEALQGELFNDRFRAQSWDRPSTTITSHMSKDGHYYIHPDTSQCRSLTVREAARLQTFPDNYFFEGPRTAQYQQVGNAVPPLLAKRIAEVVFSVLRKAKHPG